MSPPRPRFTLRWLMAAVAVSALVAWIGAWVHWACIATGWPEIILAAVVVAGGMALISMRFPLMAFPLIFVVEGLSPHMAMSHQLQTLPFQGAVLAWVVGAPTGVILRHLRAARLRLPRPSEREGPEWQVIREVLDGPGRVDRSPLGGVEEVRP